MFSAALPATSVAPSSAVSPDDINNRTRIYGRAVDAGPLPASPSVSGRHELPPNYFQVSENGMWAGNYARSFLLDVQATEPLPSQLSPETQSRRPNMI
jgi:hypothetical protein